MFIQRNGFDDYSTVYKYIFNLANGNSKIKPYECYSNKSTLNTTVFGYTMPIVIICILRERRKRGKKKKPHRKNTHQQAISIIKQKAEDYSKSDDLKRLVLRP